MAEDALHAREFNDIVDSQEVARVVELLDELQFLFHHRPSLRRRAAGIAPPQPGFSQASKPVVRMLSVRYFVRVFVSQFVERERAASGNAARVAHGFGMLSEEAPDFEFRFEAALRVRERAPSDLIDRDPLPDARQDVRQLPSAAAVHDRVSKRDQRDSGFVGECGAAREAAAVFAVVARGYADMRLAGKRFVQGGRGRRRIFVSSHDQRTVVRPIQNVLEADFALALRCAPFSDRQQAAEIAVALSGFRISENVRTVRGGEPCADNESDAQILSGGMAADDSCEGVLVGDRDRRQSEFLRSRDQLFRMRSTNEEGEIARDRKFGVAHGNLPATNQSPLLRAG